MNHEIYGPENRIIGRIEASELAMPGQLRIPKDIAISKHIAQFWNPQNHGEIPTHNDLRDSAIAHMAKTLDVSPKLLDKNNWAQNNLIWELHEHGNDEAARRIAKHSELTNSDPVVRNLMLKTAALLVYLNRDYGWEQAHEDIDDELTPIIRDIVKTNADWPNQKTVWQEQWAEELKNLKRETYRPAGAFGVQTEYVRWIVDRQK